MQAAYSTVAPDKDYRYNGKELNGDYGMDLYEYGFRWYDAAVGRWHGVDPLADYQESRTPYGYSLNSPLVYIDPDGSLPILINGRVAGCESSCRGSKDYWGEEILRTIANSGIPNPGGQRHFVDGDRHMTQDEGGFSVIAAGSYFTGNIAWQRTAAGYSQASDDFEKIISKLERDPETGLITENIQIYSHSRGSAFAEGYTKRLIELIKENSDLFADPNGVVNLSMNLAPHQSWAVDATDGVPSYSFHHNDDKLSGNSMEGVLGAFSSGIGNGTMEAHGVSSFVNEVGAFLSSYNSNGASQATINDFVSKMQNQYGIKVTVQ
ncbi:MAG: RHS repeat-associated core domain-containing protein [Phaeodactylibacter xiamenensis]|uniref:RHS repeat-associated core domain-containing protein n=1 Tax=Phaeodactylibacter xiamenensis TaxID=1524460 RepID=A0A098S780_9BACT|nr:RHS repeat-associated core domain-containing protein [Phaeodactylibacter xiamenensis]KGE87951.1 hypothetical protein IX84_12590 [Phaeodactylibacter xiamenensis]MCR9053848.1 RHS repeat-associated core domain-containing protein [bacterium]